jgi:hypothetical protein
VTVTSPPYPAPGRATTQAYPAREAATVHGIPRCPSLFRLEPTTRTRLFSFGPKDLYCPVPWSDDGASGFQPRERLTTVTVLKRDPIDPLGRWIQQPGRNQPSLLANDAKPLSF